MSLYATIALKIPLIYSLYYQGSYNLKLMLGLDLFPKLDFYFLCTFFLSTILSTLLKSTGIPEERAVPALTLKHCP